MNAKLSAKATVATEEIECGYYDSGSLASSPTDKIKAGCVSKYTVRNPNGLVGGYIDVLDADTE